MNRLLRDDSGFSLIEVVVSAALLISTAVGVLTAMDAAGATSGRDRARAQASALAQQDQDRMRAMSPSALADLAGDTQTPRTVTLGKLSYSVTSHVEWKSDQSSGSVSCSGSSPPTYLQITSTVSGTPLTGLKDITTDSLVAMPAGSTGGVLRVTIKDSQTPTPQPVSGVTVQAISAGGGITPTTTNASGCAVLTSLPNGTYTVKAQRTGFIDINGNDQPTVVGQRVFTAQTTDVTFTMEQAGTLTAKFWTNANGWTQATSPAQRWDRITTLGSGITRKFGTPRQAGVVADVKTQIQTKPGDTTPNSAGLWPGTTGITPGECANEDYALSPTPLYSASVPRATGGNVDVVMFLPAIWPTIQYGGSAVQNAVVKLIRQGGDCVASNLVLPAQTTDSQGHIPYPGVAQGIYTVCASYVDPNNSTTHYLKVANKTVGNLTNIASPPAPISFNVNIGAATTPSAPCT